GLRDHSTLLETLLVLGPYMSSFFASFPGTHSLRYFLGISDPIHGVPEFISVGYVDSQPITTYDSITRQKEPRAPWMAENLAPDHWERVSHLPENDWL
uniref:MHC class I-like antigen recognition-like domain-containing protein n=1 Tax=Piliocolobus tephrosceles TaxID=591936 RepID=A0A8C9GHQ9_9PRIM